MRCSILNNYIKDTEETKGMFFHQIETIKDKEFWGMLTEYDILAYSRKHEAYKFFFPKDPNNEPPL
jgi:hypothetical protein